MCVHYFQVGFGKVSPINTIWVGGVTASLSEQQLERHFHRYGHVTRVVINRLRGQALISFDSVESAGVAQADMKGRPLYGRRVRVSSFYNKISFNGITNGYKMVDVLKASNVALWKELIFHMCSKQWIDNRAILLIHHYSKSVCKTLSCARD